MPNTMSLLIDGVEISALVDGLRRDPALAGRREAALQEMVAQVDRARPARPDRTAVFTSAFDSL